MGKLLTAYGADPVRHLPELTYVQPTSISANSKCRPVLCCQPVPQPPNPSPPHPAGAGQAAGGGVAAVHARVPGIIIHRLPLLNAQRGGPGVWLPRTSGPLLQEGPRGSACCQGGRVGAAGCCGCGIRWQVKEVQPAATGMSWCCWWSCKVALPMESGGACLQVLLCRHPPAVISGCEAAGTIW